MPSNRVVPPDRLWHRVVVAVRTVWVDDWQMQCCGEPFEVGASIEWTVLPVTDATGYAAFLEPHVVARITDREDHHTDSRELVTMRGVVRSIDAVFCRYRVRGKAAVPVERSGVLEQRRVASGWEADDEVGAGRTFVGYLVALEIHGSARGVVSAQPA